MKHAVKHDLEPELAKRATVCAWEAYAERYAHYGPRATWTSETHADIEFTVRGVALQGSFELRSDSVDVDLKVPLLFRPFRQKVLSIIDREIQHWLHKARAGEL